MKTRYIVGLFLVGSSVLSSCSDFTEIDQKGMNLLSTTDQLEMLLNQEYNIRIADIQRVCGSVQYYPGNVGTVLANPVKKTPFSKMPKNRKFHIFSTHWIVLRPRRYNHTSYLRGADGTAGPLSGIAE